MTLTEQIDAQAKLMESKGAIGMRLQLSTAAWHELFPDAKAGETFPKARGTSIFRALFAMEPELVPGMEGFAILATWPEQ